MIPDETETKTLSVKEQMLRKRAELVEIRKAATAHRSTAKTVEAVLSDEENEGEFVPSTHRGWSREQKRTTREVNANIELMKRFKEISAKKRKLE